MQNAAIYSDPFLFFYDGIVPAVNCVKSTPLKLNGFNKVNSRNYIFHNYKNQLSQPAYNLCGRYNAHTHVCSRCIYIYTSL